METVSRVLEYSSRVRKIEHRGWQVVPAVLDALQHCAAVFPRLTHVVLISQGCMVPPALASSPYLQDISISIGHSATMGSIVDKLERGDAAALFLQHARTQAPCIHTLSITGRINAKLGVAIASYTQLRSLSVHGLSFGIDTFAAVAAFPFLETLDLSVFLLAGEIRACVEPNSATFPALRSLTMRTYGPISEPILSLLPVGTLTKLRLELIGREGGPGHMRIVFQTLAEKTSDSLGELQVMMDQEIMEETGNSRCCYDLELIGPLASLKKLRRFTLYNSILTDVDLPVIAEWWPALEHLVLDGDKSCLTPAAHSIVALSFSHLLSVHLPVAPPSPNP